MIWKISEYLFWGTVGAAIISVVVFGVCTAAWLFTTDFSK
jgi:hypothetical protein